VRPTPEGKRNARSYGKRIDRTADGFISDYEITVSDPTPRSEQVRWFTEEVHAHDSTLKAYLRGAFPAVRDVDDVVQESYLRVWKFQATAPIRSAKALLFTVARRLALDLVRRDRRSPFVPVKDFSQLIVLDMALDAAESAAFAQDIALLAEAIDSLPARCREIFLLCQVEGLAQREVAGRLGLSENTVAVQSARGLQRCERFVRRRLNRP
jgi:RNA polymerase sigma factor (sigma-70 family)